MNAVTVLYFASFRERLNLEKETIDLTDDIKTISNLKQLLAHRQDNWKDIFSADKNALTSINQSMAKDHSLISDQDEIAFFPPVTGG